MRTGVLIVGAGPTGLVLACDLLGRGVPLMLIDRLPAPAITSRAIGLQPRGLEILQSLSAAEELGNRAVTVQGSDIYVDRRLVLQLDQRFEDIGPLLIGQQHIEARLRERLAQLGGSIAWNHEFVGTDESSSGVSARLETPSGPITVSADWLVGCDGAHSRVRKAFDFNFEGESFPQTMILADLGITWNRPRDRMCSWLHPDGIFAAAPLPNGKWRLFAEVNADDPITRAERDPATGEQKPDAPPDDEVTRRLRQLFRERVGDRSACVETPTWLSVFGFSQRLVSGFRHGRVLLAGDAAHIHSAQGAQGMNLGMGDAFNLGWKLALVQRGYAPASLLDTYDAERRPVAAGVVRRTGLGWRITLGKTPFTRALRDWLVLPAMGIRAVQRRMAKQMSQRGISYRGGPLAPTSFLQTILALFTGGKAAPGDYSPRILREKLPGGGGVPVAGLIGNSWALLGFDMDPSALAKQARSIEERVGEQVVGVSFRSSAPIVHTAENTRLELLDIEKTVQRAFGSPEGGTVLLRPDGHVGWRSDCAEPVSAWLARVLRASS